MNSISVELDQNDLNAISALIDAAVKATGVQGAKVAIPILSKIEAAVAAANAGNDDEQKEAA